MAGQIGEILPRGRLDGIPAGAVPVCQRGDGAALLVEHDLHDIGFVVGGEQFALAGLHIEGKQCRLVASTGVDQVERRAVGAEVDEPKGIDVAERHLGKRRPGAIGAPLENFGGAVGLQPRRQPQLELAVGEEVGIFGVLEYPFADARHDIDPEQIEPALVALVMPDQHLFGIFAVDFLQERLDAMFGRQRHGRAIVDGNAVGTPVLVAVALPEKHQMATGIGPAEIAADIAIGDAGHGPRRGRIGDRRYPQIVDAADRRDIGELQSIRADPHIAAIGIVEEDPARHQPGLLGVRPAHEPGKGQRRAKRSGAKDELAAVDRRDAHANLPSCFNMAGARPQPRCERGFSQRLASLSSQNLPKKPPGTAGCRRQRSPKTPWIATHNR